MSHFQAPNCHIKCTKCGEESSEYVDRSGPYPKKCRKEGCDGEVEFNFFTPHETAAEKRRNTR